MALAGMENIPLEQQVNTQLAPVSGPDVRYQPAPLQPDEDAAQAAGASALTPAVPLPSGLSPSIADQLNKLGFTSRVHQTADKLAAASPNPNAPGAWARSLVGATSSALAGFGNIASDIAAGAEKPVPLGAPGGIVGIARALQNRKQRQQEMQTEAFRQKHNMAQEQIDMMHVDQMRKSMALNDPDREILNRHVESDKLLAKPYEGGENGEGAAPILGSHLTEAEIIDGLKPGGKFQGSAMHRYADGVIDSDKKDKYGNPVPEQTYIVYGNPPEVSITPEIADRFKKYHITDADGKEITAGTPENPQKLPGDVYGQLSQLAQTREAAQDMLDLTRDKFGAERATAQEHADNDRIRKAAADYIGKGAHETDAAGNDVPVDPHEATIKAYIHMTQDTNSPFKDEGPAVAKYFFGDQKTADKAVSEYVNEQENEAIQNRATQLGLDPADRIGSLKKLAEDRDVNGNLTRIANAASHQLSIIPEPEKETYRKDIASEADKASKQKQQADQTAQGDTDLTGEAYLNSLPKDHQPLVRQIASGQMRLESIQRILTKQPGLIEEAALYDPQFDGSKIKGYEKVVNDFNSGKTSNQLVAINTLLPHLDTLLTNLNAGFGTTVPGISTLEQKAGNDQAVAVKIARQQATQELAAAYATGAVTDQQHKSFEEELNTSSPYELRKSIKDISELLESKLSALQDKWEEGAPSPRFKPKHPIVSPTAQAALDRIKSDTDHTDYSLTNAQGQKVTYRSLQDMLAAQQAQKTGQMQRQQVNPQTGHLAGNPFATPTPTPTPQVQQ